MLRALNWLKLNHPDYADVEICEKTLNEYPEDSSSVIVTYKKLILISFLKQQILLMQMKNLVSGVVDSVTTYWYYCLVLVDAKGLLHI